MRTNTNDRLGKGGEVMDKTYGLQEAEQEATDRERQRIVFEVSSVFEDDSLLEDINDLSDVENLLDWIKDELIDRIKRGTND